MFHISSFPLFLLVKFNDLCCASVLLLVFVLVPNHIMYLMLPYCAEAGLGMRKSTIFDAEKTPIGFSGSIKVMKIFKSQKNPLFKPISNGPETAYPQSKPYLKL